MMAIRLAMQLLKRQLLPLFLLLCGGAIQIVAQQIYQTPSIPNPLTPLNDTGVQAYGVYDGVKEDVGLSNGNLNVQIPLLKLPQRAGGTFELSAVYDSLSTRNLSVKYLGLVGAAGGTFTSGSIHSLYQVSFASGMDSLAALPGAGWRLGLATLTTDWIVAKSAALPNVTSYQGAMLAENSYCWGNWTLTMSDGSKHAFANQVGCQAACADMTACITATTRKISDANDGTYMRLDTSNMSDIVIYLKDGSEMHFYNGANGMPGVFYKLIDRNGNVITTQK